jgi:hypothetical protein
MEEKINHKNPISGEADDWKISVKKINEHSHKHSK